MLSLKSALRQLQCHTHVRLYIRLHSRSCSSAQLETPLHPERVANVRKTNISDEVLKKHAKETRYLLQRCNDIHQVCKIIDDSPFADTVLFNAALHQCFSRLYAVFNFDDVQFLLTKMQNERIPKNINTYHEILKIYSRSGDFKQCMRYFNHMVDKDRIRPNAATFNRLMKCARYSQNMHYANEVLQLMQNDFDVVPDVYTYIELMYLYKQLNTAELLSQILDDLNTELKKNCYQQNQPYSVQEYESVFEAFKENNIGIERVEQVFATMVDKELIPNEEIVGAILNICIERKDTLRIVSYFDMLVELMEDTTTNRPLSIAINALEFIIGQQHDFLSAYFFIDNCIRYQLQISKKSVLSLYEQCIQCTFLDLAEDLFSTPLTLEQWETHKKYVIKLTENVRDLPAQLQHLKLVSTLNKYRVIPSTVHDIYSTVLMAFLKLKIMTNETADGAVEDSGESESQILDGDVLVYDILSHWYDSYYITADLWHEYKMSESGEMQRVHGILSEDELNRYATMTVFNVCDWRDVELKILLVFIILERFGNEYMSKGMKHLNVQLTDAQSLDETLYELFCSKFKDAYGDGIKLQALNESINNGIVQIDLQSWSDCVYPETIPSETDSEDEDAFIDKEVYIT